MNKLSLKSLFIKSGLISEVTDDWKKDFFMGSKGMPKTTEDVLNYIFSIYTAAFGGEGEIKIINKKMVKWLVEQIQGLGGPTNIGTADRDKLITVMAWFKVAGGEGNLPKMDLNTAYEFSKKKLEEKNKKNIAANSQDHPEPPITKVEEEGLVERVYTIPDGSGRVWVKVNQKRAGEFFDKLCDANKAYGVGCQSSTGGYSMVSSHRESSRITYTLLGPESGKKVPITTIMSISIDIKTKNIVEGKQVGNQNIGSNLYGWNDLYDKFVQFLATPIAKETIDKTSDYTVLSWPFANKKFDTLNKLDLLRPDFIENSKTIISRLEGGKQWLENRKIDAVQALKKYGIEYFIENIESYKESASFKDALLAASTQIPDLAKKKPNLFLSKITYLLEFLPIEDFKNIVQNINLESYILTNKSDFENVLKKLTNVNSKDSKFYREIFKFLIENNFDTITRSFGEGLDGVKKFMNFLEMPKSDKHKFIKKNPGGKIIASRKEVKREGGIETSKDVEFELPEQLAVTTQKERRDLLKNNEEYIKNLIEGDADKKEVNFLRLLFGESNPQDIRKTLKPEKDKLIKYYDDPSHFGKFSIIRGVPLPGIFEFYRIFNKGEQVGVVEGKEKPYYKFELEDLHNPEIAKTVINFFAKLYKADEKVSNIDAVGQYKILDDYIHMLEIAGESKEKITEIINKYKPTQLQFFKNSEGLIPLVVYEKYYSLLTNYTSKENAITNIKENKEEIVKRMGLGEYEKLLNLYSTPAYDVEYGHMVEFLGELQDDYDINGRKIKTRKSTDFLDKGRKYEVTRVVYPEESGAVLNSKIRVLDNSKNETGWMPTTDFKVPIKYINESEIVLDYVRRKLVETYLKQTKK